MMHKNKAVNKIMATCMFVLLTIFSYASAQVIRVGMSAAYEPFEFRDSKKKIVGFDVDFANAICSELKWTCNFSDHAFNTLIPKLEKNQIDLIISAFDINNEIIKTVRYSDPYFHSGGYFIAKKGTYKSSMDLQDKNVGVLKGRLHQIYLTKNFPGINIIATNHIPTSLKNLVLGKLDAIFIDDSIGDEFIRKNPNFEIVGGLVQDASYFSGYAVVGRRSDSDRINKVNLAIEAIKKSGRYQEIYDKWFSDKEWDVIN